MELSSVALFCGSSSGKDPKYAEIAREFGNKCADLNLVMYYGGAGIGLMWEAAGTLLKRNGKVIGVAPSFFSLNTVLNSTISQMILVDTMSERKQLLEKSADAFVILPGSYGTMDEFFEVITDAQLGLHAKPVAILNAFGYYDALIALLNNFKEEGFLRPFHYDLFVVSDTVNGLFEKLVQYENSNDHQWLSKIKKQG